MSDAFKEYESTGRIGEDKGVSVQPLVGPTATDYGKWISVKDKLPRFYEDVLIVYRSIADRFDNPVRLSIGYYDIAKKQWTDVCSREIIVTHWANRPSLPE